MTYLLSGNKADCTGCGACQQVCGVEAIVMEYDDEGFAYPVIDQNKCVNCGACVNVCPLQKVDKGTQESEFNPIRTFGGSHKQDEVLLKSTSGGAFTAICQAWAEQPDYVIYGAYTEKLDVWHMRLTDINELDKICKSKYRQSSIGDCYKQVKQDLKNGKNIIFSGTPCHIGGLLSFLGKTDKTNLLTIEVICEGVPSPLFIDKMMNKLAYAENSEISAVDYRYKGKNIFGSPIKWDYEMMQASFRSGRKWHKDRWFNPFWNIWLQHLMSRPSCYECIYACPKRNSDITLGDLWGVHLYCPDLYNKNKGASLVMCNTPKGAAWMGKATKYMTGHDLDPKEVIKFQGPLRRKLPYNPQREAFMGDLKDNQIAFEALIKKWYQKPSLKLLISKYIWGNRHKIWVWKQLKRLGITYRIR